MSAVQTASAQRGFDRPGGDYRSFDIASDPSGETCKKTCEGESRCRAWTYVRPGYLGPSARCFLKQRLTAPRPQPCLRVRSGAVKPLGYR